MTNSSTVETLSVASRIYKENPPSKFIAGPYFDIIFFIASPLIALLLGIVGSFTALSDEKFVLNGHTESWMSIFVGSFTMAHLVIVFFRSHLNPSIFQLYPKRFILAPLLLFSAMLLSSWVLVFVFVLAVWWDVYHSSLQTFGLGRIYDARLGSDSEEVRSLDRLLNILLYIGPIFAGVTLMDHVIHFEKFSEVGTVFFTKIPARAEALHGFFTRAILIIGTVFFSYYFYRTRQLAQKGVRVSSLKLWLYASTGFCSLYTWGFNSFGQAFFIMNFFHALQYFALIWWAEKNHIAQTFRLKRTPWGKTASLTLLILLGSGYGVWAKIWGESSHLAFSILLTVSIMHFWYDGFIWSVSRKQVG